MKRSCWGLFIWQINMTEWIWPKSVNMTENWQQQTFTWLTWPKFEINIVTTTKMNMWVWPKIKKRIISTTTTKMNMWTWLKINIFNIWSSSIVYFRRCGNIFYLFLFRSNSIVFGQVQQVNVPCCHFWSSSNQ